MTDSVKQRVGAAQLDKLTEREILALFVSIRTDLNSLATQFNQLRTDYNANATIATDTTATAVTLNTLV
jgi:hypothetical protein